jgi:hypothetical protein
LTSEQLEASRAERLRLNGQDFLNLEDARTWLEETGLCLFLPRRQYPPFLAPSFVEAVMGQRDPNPDPKKIARAEDLLVRLEKADIAVRLNLAGQPGDHPDFVVAAWVLPYVYALRGDRDWRRTPQLTGSRQVSPLAVQAYKQLEAGDATIPKLRHALGREVSESAVLRAITELWQQLRIIPVVSAPGEPPTWQLLRLRYQKAIAEGASTSQVTAISVLASIYLQAVIAASMEDVELFLAPLTARSKVREVLRGLVATRQVHTLSLGHAPHYYVAGTLPEFPPPPTSYASAAMPASSYFLHSYEDEVPEVMKAPVITYAPIADTPEPHAARMPVQHKPAPAAKAPAPRPHFSRPAVPSRDRKPAQAASSSSRVARRPQAESRTPRWPSNGAKNAAPRNGSHAAAAPAHRENHANGTRHATAAPAARPHQAAAHAAHGAHSLAQAAKSRPAVRSSRKPALTAASRQRTKKR